MADTTNMTAAQITAAAAAGATTTLVAAQTAHVTIATAVLRFYLPDAAAPVQGLRVSLVAAGNQIADVRVADIPQMSASDQSNLKGLLEKLYVLLGT